MKIQSLLFRIIFIMLVVNTSFAQNFVESKCTLKSGKVIQGLIKNDFKDTDEFLYFKLGSQDE